MKMIQLNDFHTRIFLNEAEESRVPFVLVNTGHDEDEALFETLRKLCDKGFALICIETDDWNDDLSPWHCDPVFKGTEPFSGKADLHLARIIDDILPKAEEKLSEEGISPSYHAIVGYSLAGLFALYSGYKTDVFEKIVSASGSLWYPDFLEFTRNRQISQNITDIYLSLGDQESHTKNKLMAAVQENTETIAAELGEKVKVFFEMNEGNHFREPDLRLAKGIAYILNNRSASCR